MLERVKDMTGSGTLAKIDANVSQAGVGGVSLLNSKTKERFQKLKATLPVSPLLLFMVLFLLMPMLFIVRTAISDGEISRSLPGTLLMLSNEKEFPPSDEVYKTLGQELKAAVKSGELRPLGRRIGYELPRGLNILLDASRSVSKLTDAVPASDWKAAIVASNDAWARVGVWSVIAARGASYSTFYLEWALGFDVVRDVNGDAAVDQGYDFRSIYARTIIIALVVTALTVLIGYPLAYVISISTGRMAGFLLFLILLPFWTSLLVRTMSWIVMLQTNGVLNNALLGMGLTDEPLKLLYTRAATVLAMIQIQLPFTVLPMISVMKAIPPSHVRAARSLGAGPIRAHVSVFMPQAAPGVAAGGLLTFVLCLGFYLTPALVGGPADQMVSFFIARFTNDELNWGLASALSLVLVVGASLIAFPLARHVATHASDRI